MPSARGLPFRVCPVNVNLRLSGKRKRASQTAKKPFTLPRWTFVPRHVCRGRARSCQRLHHRRNVRGSARQFDNTVDRRKDVLIEDVVIIGGTECYDRHPLDMAGGLYEADYSCGVWHRCQINKQQTGPRIGQAKKRRKQLRRLRKNLKSSRSQPGSDQFPQGRPGTQ